MWLSSIASAWHVVGCYIEIFLIPTSVPQLVWQSLWYVLSYLWDGAYKRSLAANKNVALNTFLFMITWHQMDKDY